MSGVVDALEAEWVQLLLTHLPEGADLGRDDDINFYVGAGVGLSPILRRRCR